MWNKHEGFASTYFILRKIHLNPCARKNWHHLTPFLPTFGHHFPCPKHRRLPRRPRTMCMCCNFSWTRCSSVVLRVSHHPCQFLRQNYSNILPKRFFETFWNFKKHFDLKSSFQQKKTGKKHPWCCFIHRFPNVSPATPPPPAAARWRSSTPAPAKRRWPQRRAAAAGRPMNGSKPLTIFGKWGHCDVFMIQTLWYQYILYIYIIIYIIIYLIIYIYIYIYIYQYICCRYMTFIVYV